MEKRSLKCSVLCFVTDKLDELRKMFQLPRIDPGTDTLLNREKPEVQVPSETDSLMPSRRGPGVRQESEDRDLSRSLSETITDSVSDAGARDISETIPESEKTLRSPFDTGLTEDERTDTAPITDSLVRIRLWLCRFGFP